jgi:hypothetical protein
MNLEKVENNYSIYKNHTLEILKKISLIKNKILV